jgi:hypothetical protein
MPTTQLIVKELVKSLVIALLKVLLLLYLKIIKTINKKPLGRLVNILGATFKLQTFTKRNHHARPIL